MIKLKPIVGYVGGKRRIAKKIIDQFPKDLINSGDYTYYEPFVGMGAVFLTLRPKNAVISDSNRDIINIWKQIKKHPIKLYNILADFEPSKQNYFSIVRWLNSPANKKLTLKRAAYYIITISYSYVNHVRFDKNGDIIKSYFRGPVASTKNKFIYQYNNYKNISNYLNSGGIKILHGDYITNLDHVKKKAIIYMDPPYTSDRINAREYFSNINPNQLINIFNKLNKLKNRYVYLSNSKLFYDRYKDHFNKENINVLKINTIHAIEKLSKRTRNYEVLIYSS